MAAAATVGPRPLVICGPSGSGKSTLLKRLFAEYPNTFGFSVSHTTRQPRAGEVNGIDYHYVTRDHMEKAIANDEFIESACFGGNMYGTSKASVHDVQDKGKVCVLDIEMEGVKQIKKSDLNPILVFNNPPSVEELKKRLLLRNTETEESLQKRLDSAQKEIHFGNEPGNFDIIILNDIIDEAYAKFKDFVISEIKKQQEQGVQINLDKN
ncbi:guanylate kinase [Eupeodes corollae]|uniref:guanylate kinase n=1 Tax=Eupeodes corollae TaxID=290404 RepID=UPI0024900E64|nr:guanylate kinase [Eupeodes corollae]